MTRDHDYIRKLLTEAEASDQPFLYAIHQPGSDPDEVKRHVHVTLLTDAGLLAKVGEHAFRLTNQGHDYLDVIRDDGVWGTTKDVATRAGGATLGVMKDIAVALVKQKASEFLGLPLG